MTALDLIKQSLQTLNVASVGDSLGNDEAQDCLTVLNMLIDSWSTQGLALYCNTDSTYAVTSGQASYTLGAGADWDGTRPTELTSAFIRSNSTDYPMQALTAEEYAGIGTKTSTADIPETYYYNPTWPNGTVTLWPVPSANSVAGLSHRTQIATVTSLQTDIDMPPGYLMAFRYGLAAVLAPTYGKAADHDAARVALANVKRVNVQPLISQGVDPYMMGHRHQPYNIYNDGR